MKVNLKNIKPIFIKYNKTKSELLRNGIISFFWPVLYVHDRARNEMSKFACLMATLFRTQRRNKTREEKEKEKNERKQGDLLLPRVKRGGSSLGPVKVFIVADTPTICHKPDGFPSADPQIRTAAIYKEKLCPRDRVMSSRCKYMQLSVCWWRFARLI